MIPKMTHINALITILHSASKDVVKVETCGVMLAAVIFKLCFWLGSGKRLWFALKEVTS